MLRGQWAHEVWGWTSCGYGVSLAFRAHLDCLHLPVTPAERLEVSKLCFAKQSSQKLGEAHVRLLGTCGRVPLSPSHSHVLLLLELQLRWAELALEQLCFLPPGMLQSCQPEMRNFLFWKLQTSQNSLHCPALPRTVSWVSVHLIYPSRNMSSLLAAFVYLALC